MYSLKVLKSFSIGDGAINYAVGHDCNALDAFEVAELITEFPDCFEPNDELTKALVQDEEKMKHLADAVKRKQEEEAAVFGKLKAVKK